MAKFGDAFKKKVEAKQESPPTSNEETMSLHDQENLVQMVGKMVRGGEEMPDVDELRRKCGLQSLTEYQRNTALKEARERSPEFDHLEIVSKARWPEQQAAGG